MSMWQFKQIPVNRDKMGGATRNREFDELRILRVARKLKSDPGRVNDIPYISESANGDLDFPRRKLGVPSHDDWISQNRTILRDERFAKSTRSDRRSQASTI